MGDPFWHVVPNCPTVLLAGLPGTQVLRKVSIEQGEWELNGDRDDDGNPDLLFDEKKEYKSEISSSDGERGRHRQNTGNTVRQESHKTTEDQHDPETCNGAYGAECSLFQQIGESGCRNLHTIDIGSVFAGKYCKETVALNICRLRRTTNEDHLAVQVKQAMLALRFN